MNPAEESRKRRNYDAFQSSRNSSISPPPKRHATSINGRPMLEENQPSNGVNAALPPIESSSNSVNPSKSTKEATKSQSKSHIPSPVQLNFVEELPASSNVDCISLGSILGDPMIKECWLFNYLFDIDFVMRQFDQDTRDLVQVRVVHGSWKREDPNRIHIEDAAQRYPNIKTITAYMPEMYGTHHTKAMVLFKHDDLAQVVILTANFIQQDFRMSQAIWRTPLLPLEKAEPSFTDLMPPLGSGRRFKHDLLTYFRGYSRKGTAILSELISQLKRYDFSAVRGALVGSIPGSQMPGQFEPDEQDQIGRWGLPALKHILSSIPTNTTSSSLDPTHQPHIIAQVSSIASVGEKWLLSTLIPTLSTTKGPSNPHHPKPKISIIFPTATNIRNSVDGYGSGSSIHIKTTTTAQAKQLAVLKPMLCHWFKPPPPPIPSQSHASPHHPHPHHHHHQQVTRQAGRSRAAPHIKTYIRFSSASQTTIDWALMTSANLSTQAWGSTPNPSSSGAVKISSYELGVLVWPALWDEHDPLTTTTTTPADTPRTRTATMVPVFGTDMPSPSTTTPHAALPGSIKPADNSESDHQHHYDREDPGITIGYRMPYDLPLTPYSAHEKPWCASEACSEPDWMGRVWPGYGH